MRFRARYFDKWDWCKTQPHPIVYKGEDRIEYCVFHAPKGKKGVSVDEFNRLVYEEIERAMAENRDCELSGTIFDGDIDFRKYGGNNRLPPINFTKALFNGRVDFRGAVFSGDANFFGAMFIKGADFSGATFMGKAYFFDSEFLEKADFSSVRFVDELSFSWGSCKKEVEFAGAIFESNTNFKRPTFD